MHINQIGKLTNCKEGIEYIECVKKNLNFDRQIFLLYFHVLENPQNKLQSIFIGPKVKVLCFPINQYSTGFCAIGTKIHK